MIKVTELAFVGYPVTDVVRARAFYEGALGLKVAMAHEIQPGQWWIEHDIAGVALAISNAWPPAGWSGPGVALEVAGLDSAFAEARGGNIPVSYGPMDSLVCRFFGIKNPDGNDIALHQRNWN